MKGQLALDRVVKRYGPTTAVDGISIDLAPGEFLSLLGPSGCGKTTTLRMIAGFIDPTDGAIILDGETISSSTGAKPPERRGMSMIFQSYAIWPNMTVFQNVSFGLRMQRLRAEEVRQRTGAILEVVQLSHLAERYPNELSGGQQQRVALARAVVVQPKVLLLDEPLSNLDANLREEMRGEIRRMHDEFSVTTVYVTHDQSEAMAISDRIAVINHGRMEQLDTPYALYTRPRTRFAAEFIGRTNLIEGEASNGSVRFAGFTVPTERLVRQGTGRDVVASLRPQAIRLLPKDAAPPADGDAIVLPVAVAKRSFLGDSWDYLVAVDGGAMTLRVSAPAWSVFEVNQEASVAIPYDGIVPVETET